MVRNGVGDMGFGLIRYLVALPDHGVIAFDAATSNGPGIMRFDGLGNPVRTIGQEGSGPGEFRGSAGPMAVNDQGILFVRDRNQGRIERFKLSGSPLDAITDPTIATSTRRELFSGPDGAINVWIQPGQGSDEALARFDADGRLTRTIPRPALWYSTRRTPDYNPTNWWGVLPDGRRIAVRSDRAGFLLEGFGGAGSYLWVEVAAKPPRFLPAERAERQALLDWFLKYDPADADPTTKTIPTSKQLVKGFLLDVQGRVWIQRTAVGRRHAAMQAPSEPGAQPTLTFREPLVFDAFLSNGAFLGEVRFPASVRLASFADDVCWAVVSSDSTGDALVKFRLVQFGHPDRPR